MNCTCGKELDKRGTFEFIGSSAQPTNYKLQFVCTTCGAAVIRDIEGFRGLADSFGMDLRDLAVHIHLDVDGVLHLDLPGVTVELEARRQAVVDRMAALGVTPETIDEEIHRIKAELQEI